MADTEQIVYLTFDDGPHQLVTPEILNILGEYRIKATFFCIGKNVAKYPEIFSRILTEGHAIGNHSYSHRSGWKMPVNEYVEDVTTAGNFIPSKLFRPPYGRITPLQFKLLKEKYKIIMWDVLSKDYDSTISDDEAINNITENVSAGSIIVMHDNDKTAQRMKNILHPIITELKNGGWEFNTL